MKEYKPERMLAISRYQNYFPILPEEIRNDIYQRMEALIEEEKGFCDKGNYKHMAQILTSIAMYEVLQQYGKTEEEAYRMENAEKELPAYSDRIVSVVQKSYLEGYPVDGVCYNWVTKLYIKSKRDQYFVVRTEFHQ